MDTIGIFIRLLESEGAYARRNAAYRLGEAKNKKAVKPLIGVLFDHDWEVRMAAAWALGHIGDAAAAHALIGMLDDKNSNVRAITAWALGEIGDPTAVDPLTKKLNDPEWDIRKNIVDALGKIGDGSVASLLVGLLEYEVAAVKSAIAETLERIGGNSVVPGLIGRLNDPSEQVRENSFLVLGRFVEGCKSMDNLQEFEKMLMEGSDSLMKEMDDALIRVDSSTFVERLQDKVEGKKKRLALQLDVLLDDKPKPPKKDMGAHHKVRRATSR
jgi:HEAT repeat protein